MRRLAIRLCALALLTSTFAAFAGCEREERKFQTLPAKSARAYPVRLTTLQPGESQPGRDGHGPYDENAWAIAQGERLYNQYNCVGCHFHGGGGIGPPLMDAQWIYGSTPQAIHDTIVEGRPNGMPSYGGHVPDDQIWQIEAYVRTLSGQASKAAEPGRTDHMQARPSEQATPTRKPEGEKAEHPG
jgi:cytochrome c oxidase cbb3-type subunit III